MAFHHELVDEADIEVGTGPAGRFYRLAGTDVWCPSATTVLRVSKSEGLEAWRNAVGIPEANRQAALGAGRGSRLHKICERYIGNDPTLDIKTQYMLDARVLFSGIKKELDANLGTVYGLELPMISRKYRVAGRCDLVAEFNGRPSIIDFKNTVSPLDFMQDKIDKYFVQTAGYGLMFTEMYGIPVDQAVILVAEIDGSCTVIVCESLNSTYGRKFIKIVRTFHETVNVNQKEIIPDAKEIVAR
jgi:genome maintenance exonuclease 1